MDACGQLQQIVLDAAQNGAALDRVLPKILAVTRDRNVVVEARTRLTLRALDDADDAHLDRACSLLAAILTTDAYPKGNGPT